MSKTGPGFPRLLQDFFLRRLIVSTRPNNDHFLKNVPQ